MSRIATPDASAARSRRLRRFATILAVSGAALLISAVLVVVIESGTRLTWPLQLAGLTLLVMAGMVRRRSDPVFDLRSDPGPDGVGLELPGHPPGRGRVATSSAVAVLGVLTIVLGATLLERVGPGWMQAVVVSAGVLALVNGVVVAVLLAIEDLPRRP